VGKLAPSGKSSSAADTVFKTQLYSFFTRQQHFNSILLQSGFCTCALGLILFILKCDILPYFRSNV